MIIIKEKIYALKKTAHVRFTKDKNKVEKDCTLEEFPVLLKSYKTT